MSRIAGGALALLALLFSVPAALAFVPAPRSSGEVRLPGGTAVRIENESRQRALDAAPAWQAFRARHGEWSAIWNEATGTPHRAFGRGIALDGYRDDAASVDAGVRGFIARNPDLFRGAPALRTVNVRRHGNTWYATYRQTLGGLDVLFADWEFRVHDSGRLTLFGADAAPATAAPSGRGALPSPVAREAAKRGLAFDPARDRAESTAEQFVLPYPTEGGIEYRTVVEVRVVTADPPADWLTYVDARTGDVLLRLNRVRNAISGTVTGRVHVSGPASPLQTRPLPDAYVSVGGTQVVTDASGAYSRTTSGTVTVSAGIRGRFANVNRVDAPNASFSASATDPATVDIPWGTAGISHVAERDAYYHVNLAHAYIKALDPAFTGLDYEMPINVNIPVTCNAFWDGTGINLYAAGGGCVNSATAADVVYHEYGHGINDRLYVQDGLPAGMLNGSLHEGTADLHAALLEDDPIVGQGFEGPGTFVRTLDNTKRWPEDNAGEVHTNGLIVGGAMWDLRKTVGLAAARQLFIRALHGHPDDLYDFVAMREMFIEVLVADDDNGDLTDGTPNSNRILAAFNAHGIGSNGYLTVAHEPIPDFTGESSVDIVASFAYSGPAITAFNPASPFVLFRRNGGTWLGAGMSPTGTPGEYRASIAAPNASVIEYYLIGTDLAGGTIVDPAGAPDRRLYRFAHGSPVTLITWDMETEQGWTVGAPTDSAVTGVWERGDPQGTSGGDQFNTIAIQPADDHSPNGTQCFVTGNFDSTYGAPYDDVDGGATTLTTPTFSALSAGTQNPFIEYWRWYTNNTGNAPSADFWQVDVSNDAGATWTPVEYTPATDGSWQRMLFRIEDYVTPTAMMKVRFVASDRADGSLVEAAVDDVRVRAFTTSGLAGVGDPAAEPLALAPPFPNPGRGAQTLRFTLPEPARATLRVYDVTGRLLATLADADLPAGSHTATWTGAEASGRRAPAGVYFVRLSVGGLELVRRMMRLN